MPIEMVVWGSKMTRDPSWLENKFWCDENFTGYFGAKKILSLSEKGIKKINAIYIIISLIHKRNV